MTTIAAGLVVRAADTGRVLMLQRSIEDMTHAGAGKWEFPGGCLDDGEKPIQGAIREWQEETGAPLPPGTWAGSWTSGVYEGFVYVVASEADVALNVDADDRLLLNPDDPDGDDSEVLAWWPPSDARDMPALRDELRSGDWDMIARAVPDAVFKQGPRELRLAVVGVNAAGGDRFVYRLGTRDGQYLGRTTPTLTRVAKGDVLRIEAHALTKTDRGYAWERAEVIHRALGRAHDLAGIEQVLKDSPALGDVHVDVPVAAGNSRKKRKKAPDDVDVAVVVKADPARQIIYGVVLEPDTMDSQGDIVSALEIEKAAHRYLKKAVRGENAVHRLQHGARGFFKQAQAPRGLVPIESFIAPADFRYGDGEVIKKGSWVLAAHVEDPAIWQDVVDGKFTGWSVGGTGIRTPLAGDDVAKEAQDEQSAPLERLAGLVEKLLGREAIPAAAPPAAVHLHIDEGAVVFHAPAQEPPIVHNHMADIPAPVVHNHVTVAARKPVGHRVEVDADGVKHYIPEEAA